MTEQIECPFCGAIKRIYLPDLGTGESELECEKCEQTFFVCVDFFHNEFLARTPDITVSEKSCHETEGK